jgi:SAM-dependent methyltransferase
MSVDPYRSAEMYDGKFAWFVEDVPFYHRLALECRGPVLELGCGAGRVTLPLARAGVNIVGLDASAAMLEAAHARAVAENLPAEFVAGDFRSFDLGRRFPLILFPFNGLAHLLDDRDLFSCLGAIAVHLEPAGRLVLDLPNPRPHLLSNNSDRVFLSYENARGERVEVWEESEYDREQRLSRVRWRHVSEAGEEVEELTLRVFFPDELDELLGRAGFAIERRLGDYDERDFGPDSPQQLLVCRQLNRKLVPDDLFH